MEMSRGKRLWTMFYTTAGISATTNGGWAIVAVMKEKFVKNYHWIEEDEMLDLMSIAQSSPGPVAINTSVLAGYRIDGILGALVTLLGTVLPPLITMTLVTIFYEFIAGNVYVAYFMKGMQAGVAALLASVTLDLFFKVAEKKSVYYYALMIIAFIYKWFTDFSILYLAIGTAVAGIIKVLFLTKKVEAKK